MTERALKSGPSLGDFLDRRTLRRMAGSRSFVRGESYFQDGRVGLLTEHEATIYAKVRGARTYRAEFRLAAGELAYACSCPVGRDGCFCKHLVAVALAWLDRKESGAAELLEEGDASEVIDLAEYALRAVEKAAGQVDDSDGYMGGTGRRSVPRADRFASARV